MNINNLLTDKDLVPLLTKNAIDTAKKYSWTTGQEISSPL
jgi:hypothetical protein